MHTTKPYMQLFDAEGAPAGVWISPDLWEQVADEVLPVLGAAAGEAEPVEEVHEPLDDWNTLKEYWDFPYPLENNVTCGLCGAQTGDWQADVPRTFVLRTANFGGLVSFQCQACKARILKRYFKDGVKEETTPFSE